jgi:hypothetical protein
MRFLLIPTQVEEGLRAQDKLLDSLQLKSTSEVKTIRNLSDERQESDDGSFWDSRKPSAAWSCAAAMSDCSATQAYES